MPELKDDQRKQLDNNIKTMLQNGASEEDIVAYSKDFNEKFLKKKVESTPSPLVLADTTSASTGGESAPQGINYLGGDKPVVQTTEQANLPPANIPAPTAPVDQSLPPSMKPGPDGQPMFTGISQPTNEPVPQLQAAVSPLETTAKDQTNFDKTIAQKESLSPFTTGVAGLVSSVSKMPSFVYDLAASVNNIVAEKVGMEGLKAPMSQDITNMTGMSNVLAEDLDTAVKNYHDERARRYDKDLKAYFTSDKEGDFEKGLESLYLNIAEALPTTIALAMSGGAFGGAATFAGGSAMFGAQKRSDLDRENPFMNEEKKVGVSALSGAVESASESLFGVVKYLGKPLSGLFKSGGNKAVIEGAKEMIEQTYGKAFARYFGSAAEEITTEVANQFAQNAIDKYSGVDPNRELDKGVWDAAITAFGMSKAIGSPVLAGEIASVKASREQAKKNQDQKVAIEKDIASPAVSDEAKKILSKKAKDINEADYKLAVEERNKYEALTPENRSAADAISKKVQESEKALTDPNLSDESRMYIEQDLLSLDEKLQKVYEGNKTIKKEVSTEGPAPFLTPGKTVDDRTGKTTISTEVTTKQTEPLTVEEKEELQTLQAIEGAVKLDPTEKARFEELKQRDTVPVKEEAPVKPTEKATVKTDESASVMNNDAPVTDVVATETTPQPQVTTETKEVAPAAEVKSPVAETKKTKPVRDEVELPPLLEGRGMPRKMVKNDNGVWMQEVGGELTKVGPTLQKMADAAFAEKNTNESSKPGYFEQKAIDENRDLSEDQKEIETNFARDLDENYEQRKKEYIEKNGNVFDTDRARELSPDYVNDPTKSQAVHVPAREFVTRVYKEELAKGAPEGKQNVVTFTSGGSGAGKTMAVNAAKDDSHLVIDTNLSRFEDAKNDIQEALDAGKQVNISFVYRDPKSAFIDGVMGGRNRGGRTVPLDVAMNANKGSLETIKQLADLYKDNPDVQIKYYNNSKKGSPMQPLSLEDVKRIENDYEQIKKEVQDEIDRQYQSGQIDDRQYKGFSGRTEAPLRKNDTGGVQEMVGREGENNVIEPGERTEKPRVSAGNRLFNEPIKGIKSIADKYYKRVFGKARPEYDGREAFDKERSKKIAKAYADMKHDPNNKEVRAAYEALAKETIDQYNALIEAGYEIEINNSDAYANSQELIDDVSKTKRIKIFSTESGFGESAITEQQRKDNPMLADSGIVDVNGNKLLVNDVFRAVHDLIGHGELGNSFGPKGEEVAYQVHARMFSPIARKALATETRGQNSFVNFSGINEEVKPLVEKARKLREEGKEEEAKKVAAEIYEKISFADQKIGLLPDEFIEIDEVDDVDSNEPKKKAPSNELLDEEDLVDEEKVDDKAVVDKFMQDIDLFKTSKDQEAKFAGMLSRLYKAKEEGKIKKTTYTAIRNTMKNQLGEKYRKEMNKEDAKIKVSSMMEKVKARLLGEGYKNIVLSSVSPITPKTIADLIDLTTKIIHRGIDAGYTISEATRRAMEAIKSVPAYKKLVDGKELNGPEFEKMVDTAITAEIKGTKEKMAKPDIFGEEKERKTATRMKATKGYEDILNEMGNDEETYVDPKNYQSIKLDKAEAHIKEVLREVEKNGQMEDLAVEMVKGNNPFFKPIQKVAEAMVIDKIRMLAEKEGNEMQKSALTKLAAELAVNRMKDVTVNAQSTAMEQMIAESMPLSKEGITDHISAAMSNVQDTHLAENQKSDVSNVQKDIKSLLLEPEAQKAIEEAVNEKLNDIAEKLKGKEWVDEFDAEMDNLKIDLNDC